jgi:2-methylisocitrate lyase-like PEP mutase family enzyme
MYGKKDWIFLLLPVPIAMADHGLEEAMERARAFSEIGADILFIEAHESVEEMQTICREVGRL